jgi:predicted metal-dependent phosphoesterase TrpH
MAVDLHTHTTFSDGTLTPLQLLQKADYLKIKAIAITDHDEIGAHHLLKNLDYDYHVSVVSGVELSIDITLSGTAHLHLLGLFLDVDNDELNYVLNDLRDARQRRAHKIIEKLNDIGLQIKNSEIDEIIGEGSAGRPHIAKLLIDKNIVGSVWEAFNKYLSKGRSAYVSKKKLPLKRAIDLIHNASGLAILAHPVSLKHRRYKDTEDFLRELKYLGLDGVEAYYSTHTPNFTKYLVNAAQRHKLLVSGGSDFHGKVKPETELGRGRGNLNIPDDVYFNLKVAAQN